MDRVLTFSENQLHERDLTDSWQASTSPSMKYEGDFVVMDSKAGSFTLFVVAMQIIILMF